MIGNHLLPETSLLKGLYNWPGMIAFVADIVGAAALYQNEDKYQPVNVNCYSEGDQSAWHFNSWNAFTSPSCSQRPIRGRVGNRPRHTLG